MCFTQMFLFSNTCYLFQLLQKFYIEVSPLTGDIRAKTHGLLCPAAPINVKFIDR